MGIPFLCSSGNLLQHNCNCYGCLSSFKKKLLRQKAFQFPYSVLYVFLRLTDSNILIDNKTWVL